ncbi:phage tail tape measure protein [Fusobacterium polymorphum]|uniref:phage tail tape measure protein n=1 Tax=Fusobacterium nucleatum subsp. polymorphum TaxID=76857 RepID=UPI00300BAA84
MEHVLSATLELKDKFTSKIKSAGKELNNFTSSVQKNGDKVGGLASKLKGLTGNFGGLTKGIIAAGAAFGVFKGIMAGFDFIKDSYLGYAKLDAAITRNRGIMRASAEDTAKLKSQILELGKTMPFTAQEVAEAQYYQAMAGMKTNEVLELTPKLLKMSIASGQDLASTSDILTDNISAFGLALEDADRLMDVMVATANNANTDIAGLGEAYKYVASTSKSFESMEEVNILLGTLANNGTKSGQAGRNLAAVYTRLAKSTPDIDKALKVMNLKLYDSQGKFKGLRKIVEEMRPILARMTDEQRNYILTTIFGSEQMKIITSLLGTSKEGFDTLANSIYNSKGASEDFYNLQKDTPENKIKALASAWDNLKLHIGEAVAPAITSLIENLTNKIIELTDSDTFSKENIQAFFDTVISYLNTTIDLVSDLATLLKPVIWGLKLVGKTAEVGKNIGSYLITGKSTKQNELESKIIANDNKIRQMDPQTLEEKEKRKKLFIKNEKMRKEYWDEYGETIDKKAEAGNPHAKEDLIFKPISNNSEEVASIYDERYKYRKIKKDENLEEKIAQEKDKKSTTNGYKYIIKLPEKQKTDLEKVSDKLGLKAPVTPLSTTFSPQVNVEIDRNKILESKKENIPTISPIINLKNDKDKFVKDKALNLPVKDISNKKEEPKKEIIKIATPNYDRLTSKLISAIEEQRKNTKTVVENKNLNYIVKPSEKIKVPEDKKNNKDIKVPPQNVTFSPQVNVNMGGITIKNEVDIEKTAEMAKQKIEKELRNYVQITK